MDWNGLLGFAIALGIVALVCRFTQILMDGLGPRDTRPSYDLLGQAQWPAARSL